MRVRSLLCGAAAGVLVAGLWGGSATAQRVVIDLTDLGGDIITINAANANTINSLQQNLFQGTITGQVIEGQVPISVGSTLDDTDLLINRTLVEAVGGGNQNINAFFVGTTGTEPCQSEGDPGCGIFDPESAVLQLANAQINDPLQGEGEETPIIRITALIDGFQIGPEFGDSSQENNNPNFGFAAIEGTSVRLVNSTMRADAFGNRATNQTVGDITGLTPGSPSGASTNNANGVLDVRADITVASVQFNNEGVRVRARIGDGDVQDPEDDGDPEPPAVITLADGRVYENFIGIEAIGDIVPDGPDNGNAGEPVSFFVLNSTAEAFATGNDVDNRIAVSSFGGGTDTYQTEIGNLQLNQGASITATIQNLGIGIVQSAPINNNGTPNNENDDFVNPTQLVGAEMQVKDSSIRAVAIGNRGVGIIGGVGVSTVGTP